MTVKNYFPETYVRTADAIYTIIANGRTLGTIGRREAAKIANDPEFPVGWRVEKTIQEAIVLACPWCGARPLQYEMDCDGPASTGSCGSEQCDMLQRCEGCGKDGSVRWGSVRGRLCETCDTVAREAGLMAAGDRYALVKWEA